MKVLLLCYSCCPGKGGEFGISWHTAVSLSKSHQVTVLTRKQYRVDIEAYLSEHELPNLTFLYTDPPFYSTIRSFRYFYQVHYYLWQLKSAFVVRRMTKQGDFDIVQHVSWVRCWMPSALMGAKNAKTVWGPVGAVETVPKAFERGWPTEFREEKLKPWILFLTRLDPFLRFTVKKSDMTLASSNEAKPYLESLGCKNLEVISCVALPDVEVENAPAAHASTPPLRLISIGRILPWKGFHLAIEALSELSALNVEYTIIGEGPALEALKQLVKEKNLEDKCFLPGLLKREEVFEHLGRSNILLHPSLRDSGAWVCSEAMAAGLPVICLDRGGPFLQVTEETGRILSGSTPEVVIRGLVDAITFYVDNPEKLQEHGDNGFERVRNFFTWDYRAKQYEEIYKQICR